MLLHPIALSGDHLPAADMMAIGAALLVLSLTYLALCSLGRPLHWRTWTFRLPSARIAALQGIIGAADLCCAGGILYVLLPPSASIGFTSFLAIYLLAAVASVCSHVPGGIGVFDLVMIKLLNHGDPHGMLAALLVYRAVYYLFPLMVGLLLFVAHELNVRRVAAAVDDPVGAALMNC